MKLNLYLFFICLCFACTQTREQENATAADSVEEPTIVEQVASDASEVEEAHPSESPAAEHEEVIETQETGPLVYVTSEGDKYHTADCRYSKDANPVKLQRAKSDGKTACGICKPSSTTGQKQLRCAGTTAEGKQCQRMTTDASGKCFQHKS
ncbi:MAG: hypothetical protein RIB47_05990 [Cyclobacteriaceae bacterium]